MITYVRDDVEAVAALLAEQLPVLDDRDFGELTASQGRFGYASRHLQVEIEGRVVQVQLRTVLQHAWAEFEHDIRYKGTVPAEHASEFDRRFTLAAGLLELADQEFSAIRERLRGAAPTEAGATTTRGSRRVSWRPSWPGSTPTPAGRAPTTTPGSPGCCWSWAITTLVELAEVLRATDEAAIGARMDYRYPPGAVRRLDDALLSAFGERYVAPARQRAPTRTAGHPARPALRSRARPLVSCHWTVRPAPWRWGLRATARAAQVTIGWSNSPLDVSGSRRGTRAPARAARPAPRARSPACASASRWWR